MLETIRAFAGERLRSSGDEASVRDRHAAHYQGRYGEAATLLAEATALGRRERIPDVVVRGAMGEAHAAIAQGRMGDAEAVLAARLAEVGEGASPWSRGAGRAVRGRVLLAAVAELPYVEQAEGDAPPVAGDAQEAAHDGAAPGCAR